jgi:hypothetical protein
MADDYEVGYGNPPKATRFKPGQSGNPQGRPKGARGLKTDLLEELQEQIVVREGPTQRRLSKQRAMVKSLTARAIKGDTRASSLMLNMILRLLEDDGAGQESAPLTAEERAVLDAFEERVLRRARQREDARTNSADHGTARSGSPPSHDDEEHDE